MGIAGFNAWFKAQNSQAFVPINSVQVDHVYVDLNSLLHAAVRTGKTWERFHKRLHVQLNNLLDLLQPRKSIMLAVDGPAPLAKLITQRSRRKGHGNSVSGKNRNAAALSSNVITPGTLFMADVTVSLTQWASSKLCSRKWEHLHIELSDGTVVGEGEVKILGRLARHWAGDVDSDTHVIVGDDSDLVLMACVSWRAHLYVVNTAMDGKKQLHNRMQIFSVDALHRLWLQRQLHNSHVVLQTSDAVKLLGLKLDLALMAIMCSGNDYVPGMGGITLNKLWYFYTSQRRKPATVGFQVCRVCDGSGRVEVDLVNLAALVQAQAAVAEAMAKGVPPRRDTPQAAKKCTASPSSSCAMAAAKRKLTRPKNKQDSEEEEEEDDDEEMEDEEEADEEMEDEEEDDEEMEEGEDGEKAGRAAATGGSWEPDMDMYLRCLVWVITMYVEGCCPDYRLVYGVPPPHASQFAKFLREKVQALGRTSMTMADWGPVPSARQKPLLPLACALSMLPLESAELLPAAARHLLSDDTAASPLSELFSSCPKCEELKLVANLALSQRKAAEAEWLALEPQLVQAEQQAQLGNNPDTPLQELRLRAKAAKEEFKTKQDAHRALVQNQVQHLRAAHPYKPFPVDLVSTTVASIPPQSLDPCEQPLLQFGLPVVMARVVREQAAASSSGWPAGQLGLALSPPTPGSRLPIPPSPFTHDSSPGGHPIQVACWEVHEGLTPQQQRAAGPVAPPATASAAAATRAFSTASLVPQPLVQLRSGTWFAAHLTRARYLSAPTDLARKFKPRQPAQQQQQQHRQHQAGGPRGARHPLPRGGLGPAAAPVATAQALAPGDRSALQRPPSAAAKAPGPTERPAAQAQLQTLQQQQPGGRGQGPSWQQAQQGSASYSAVADEQQQRHQRGRNGRGRQGGPGGYEDRGHGGRQPPGEHGAAWQQGNEPCPDAQAGYMGGGPWMGGHTAASASLDAFYAQQQRQLQGYSGYHSGVVLPGALGTSRPPMPAFYADVTVGPAGLPGPMGPPMPSADLIALARGPMGMGPRRMVVSPPLPLTPASLGPAAMGRQPLPHW